MDKPPLITKPDPPPPPRRQKRTLEEQKRDRDQKHARESLHLDARMLHEQLGADLRAKTYVDAVQSCEALRAALDKLEKMP